MARFGDPTRNQLEVLGANSGSQSSITAIGVDADQSILVTSRGTGLILPTVGDVMKFVTVTTVTTAGNVTLTAAQLLGGLILRDPNGGARTDTLSTAALLVAAMPGVVAGNAFYFVIRNTADAAETITVASGTGGTDSGTMTIAQSNSKLFLLRIDSATAYTVYSLGTFVH